VESLTALKTWYNNIPDNGKIEDFGDLDLVLPDIGEHIPPAPRLKPVTQFIPDREYRQSVINHQRHALKALKWYSKDLPVS
jgi:hypothetical protein